MLYRDASWAGRLRTGPASLEGQRSQKAESMHATSITFTTPETPTCEVPSNGVVEISVLPVCTGETSI